MFVYQLVHLFLAIFFLGLAFAQTFGGAAPQLPLAADLQCLAEKGQPCGKCHGHRAGTAEGFGLQDAEGHGHLQSQSDPRGEEKEPKRVGEKGEQKPRMQVGRMDNPCK